MLRKGRFQLAHGEEKDKKKVDLQAMEAWVVRHYRKSQAINATKGYLQMLCQFSDSAHPLLPNKTMAGVLSQTKYLNYCATDCMTSNSPAMQIHYD